MTRLSGFAILMFLIAALIKPVYTQLSAMGTEDNYSIPVRPIAFESATIASINRQQFVDGIAKFAERHGFAIRIGSADPDGIDLIVQLWREDFKMIVNNPLYPDTFNIAIYRTCSHNVASDQAHALMAEILAMISAIDSAG